MAKLLIATTVAATTEAFLLPYARYFRAKGWTVDAASRGAASSKQCAEAFDNCHEIEWTRRLSDVRNLVKAAAGIRRLVEGNGYDIVHVHTPIASFVTRFALRRLRGEGKVKVVYTAHGFHFHKGQPAHRYFMFKGAETAAAKWTDHLIVINREDYEAALRMLPAGGVTLTPEGIGLELEKYLNAGFSAEEISAARAEMGAKKGDTLILTVAEFSPRKRHRDLVKALALTRDPSIRVAFAGTGPLVREIWELAESKGVDDRIKFLGFRTDITLLITAADATVLSSEREGLSRAVMESMACGTPVIGADVRGIRDILKDGCGTLISVGDINALADALQRQKRQDPEVAGIIEKAMTRAKTFDVRNIISVYEKIYNKLL